MPAGDSGRACDVTDRLTDERTGAQLRGFGVSVASVMMTVMTDDERKVLDFEESNPRDDRRKEGTIRTEFAMSWVRYRQLLNRLVERQDVIAEYASVAHRVAAATATAVSRRADRRF